LGQETIYCKSLLTTAAMRLRLLLLATHHGMQSTPVPRHVGAQRLRPQTELDAQLLWLAGYRIAGPLALRADRVEQVAALLGKTDPTTPLPASPALAESIGCELDELGAALAAFGYRPQQAGAVLTFRLRRAKAAPTAPPPPPTDSPFATLARLRLAGR
jgi:hypothetical protein